jgi:hypothetical protein
MCVTLVIYVTHVTNIIVTLDIKLVIATNFNNKVRRS